MYFSVLNDGIQSTDNWSDDNNWDNPDQSTLRNNNNHY